MVKIIDAIASKKDAISNYKTLTDVTTSVRVDAIIIASTIDAIASIFLRQNILFLKFQYVIFWTFYWLHTNFQKNKEKLSNDEKISR